MGAKLLIIDDDRSITASLTLLLKQSGFGSRAVHNPTEALAALAEEGFDLVLQDMNFSRTTTGEEGLHLLVEIKARWPELPVILMTAWGSIALAVRGIRAGASDFITKPWTHQQLLQAVQTTLGLAAVNSSSGDRRHHVTRDDLDASYDFGDVIGRDPKLVKLLDMAGRVSATDASVLITGESGTGKEVLAAAVHRNSKRKNGPFVKVNLGGIAVSLFESELFGHVKGAFTDAHQARTGRFELAAGGTIFLDEIGDLDSSAQVKLLRVLQDRTYEVLGSSVTRTVDVRVVSATNRNLSELIAKGEFREDLLYRLNLIAIHLPPLRERPGDIPLLASHFLQNIGKVYRSYDLKISERALHWMQKLPWPGNIRQLRQAIERAVLMSGRKSLEVEDFTLAEEANSFASQSESLPGVGSMTIDEIEKRMIIKSLKYYDNNISKVADSLGLSRAALYRRIEKHGIKL